MKTRFTAGLLFFLVIFSGHQQYALSEDIDEIVPAPILSTWSPRLSTNGWFPKITSDGQYIEYGFGEVRVANLETKEELPEFIPPNAVSGETGCFGGWIQDDTLTMTCFGFPGLSSNQGRRFEANTTDWVLRQTNDDPNLVGGNNGATGDGHWAGVNLPPGRLVVDNVILSQEGNVEVSISDNLLAVSCSNAQRICVYDDGVQIEEYDTQADPQVEVISIKYGNIAYGSYGGTGIYGIDANGKNYNLAVVENGGENSPQIVDVNGQLWIATELWVPSLSKRFELIRPWGERESIVVDLGVRGYVNVVHVNNNFIIAANSDRGELQVVTVSSDSPRVDLSGGMPPEPLDPSAYGNSGAAPFPSQTVLPVPTEGLPTDLGQIISAIFTWSLRLIGLVIFVRFFYAGFLWFTAAGNTTRTGKAQQIMKNAVYGTLILFSAWLILNTINPDLVKGTLTLPGLSGTSGVAPPPPDTNP